MNSAQHVFSGTSRLCSWFRVPLLWVAIEILCFS